MTEEIIEKVVSDPALNVDEKETNITASGNNKQCRIFSSKPTVVKSLLQHDHFEPEWIGGEKDGCYQKREEGYADDLDSIYSISGYGPVGLLTVKSKPRSTNHQSGIVNHKSVDPEAFE